MELPKDFVYIIRKQQPEKLRFSYDEQFYIYYTFHAMQDPSGLEAWRMHIPLYFALKLDFILEK